MTFSDDNLLLYNRKLVLYIMKKSGVVKSLTIVFGIDYAIIEVKDIFDGVYNER